MIHTFLEQIAADIYKKYPEDYKELAIVFNNKRPISFLKNNLAKESKSVFWSPQFFTIEEFISQFDPAPMASDIQQFFILHEAYNELLLREENEPIEQDKFFPLAEIILRDFNQLDMNLVDPNLIFQYLRDVAIIEEQFPSLNEEQQDFLERFWSSFATENQAQVQKNFIQLWERLPLLYQLFEKKLKQLNLTTLGLVYKELANGTINDANTLNSFKKIIFVGFNAINNAEAHLFQRWQQMGKAAFYFDGDDYYVSDDLQEAGLFLRKNRDKYKLKNELGPFPGILNKKDKIIEVYPIDGDIAQAKALHLFLKNRKSDSSFSNTAIILADEQLIIPVLQSIPNDLAINVTMGFPLNQSSVYIWITLWIDIQQSYHLHGNELINKEHLESFLSIFPERISPNENLKFLKENRFTKIDFHELPATFHSFFKKGIHSKEMIALLQDFILETIQYKEDHKELFQIESKLLMSIHQILNRMESSIHQLPHALSPKVCLSFLKKYLHTVAAPLEGFPLKGIQIMGVLESRNLDFEEVIILGANEGHFPKSGSSVTLIPDSLRRAYDLPVLENQDAVSAYLFYRLLQRSEQVKIVYNQIIDQNSSGEPSRFLQQIQFESKLQFQTFPHHQEIIFSGNERLPIVIQKTPEVLAKLRKKFIEDQRAFSASALRLYMDCPLRFFIKYIAEIPEKEEEMETMDPRNFGNILHTVLEDFYQEFIGETITKKELVAKEKNLKDICLNALAKEWNLTHLNRNELDAEQKILLALVEDYAQIVINHDKKFNAIQILELENRDYYYCTVPILVAEKTEHVHINIISDRIDIADGKRRIVDYKTGSDSLVFNNLENLFDREKNGKGDKNPAVFQALLYAYVYDQKKDYETISPHLYITRNLAEEGQSALMGKINGKNSIPIDDFSIIKEEFEQRLIRLIEEIFDPEIPFQHHVHAQYCKYSDYADFCNLGEKE